jgi:hypothetical protein
MILTLAFVACISGHCRTVAMPWEGSQMQCMLFGQVEAARWVAAHPGYVVARGWRCETGLPS